MYGLGAAEGELGRFAAGKRHQLTIATKYGIEPKTSARGLAKFQAIPRRLIAAFPGIRKLLFKRTGRLYDSRDYSPQAASRSLDTSLRELQTDYVDLFVLHEPSLSDVLKSDIVPWLEQARAAGKIRAFGISGDFADVTAISEQVPALAPVVQYPSDILNRNAERMPLRHDQSSVTYGVLTTALRPIGDALKRTSSNKVNLTQVGEALIRYSLRTNPHGVVLFSSTMRERIASYCDAVEPPASSEFDEYVLQIADSMAMRPLASSPS
jgi:D-threo-aldose 1-dehydrogenase